ncbi:hypothetical protein CY34DRAFT_429734 [Suillus luteus UH-Slu-Lm8-n1]|uniref:Uncharacterized protein n=1 Tax=Suillus luteus UH-Slu-Lm8-n1 TaxID=930992 RepID=A0A0D0AFR0_9AGAM|nr:hypothetical protein CY34DRAFT_429734 [Suillus luteus UH-Slu-Lm8-n1]
MPTLNNSNVGVIAGAVGGGILGVGAIAASAACDFIRRRRSRAAGAPLSAFSIRQPTPNYTSHDVCGLFFCRVPPTRAPSCLSSQPPQCPESRSQIPGHSEQSRPGWYSSFPEVQKLRYRCVGEIMAQCTFGS